MNLILKFKELWDVPKYRIWMIQFAILVSQVLLIVGVAIFIWLNFVE